MGLWARNAGNQRGYKHFVVHILMAHILAASLPCHQSRLWYINPLLQFAINTPLSFLCNHSLTLSTKSDKPFKRILQICYMWFYRQRHNILSQISWTSLISLFRGHYSFSVSVLSYQPSLVENILFCWPGLPSSSLILLLGNSCPIIASHLYLLSFLWLSYFIKWSFHLSEPMFLMY